MDVNWLATYNNPVFVRSLYAVAIIRFREDNVEVNRYCTTGSSARDSFGLQSVTRYTLLLFRK